MGLSGELTKEELYKMDTNYVKDTGSVMFVQIPMTKHTVARTFTIEDRTNDGLNMLEIYRKYACLRRPMTPHDRLFVCYRNGHCRLQAVGINAFGRIPIEIAKYLGLDPEGYTVHCFKRTAANLRKTGQIF